MAVYCELGTIEPCLMGWLVPAKMCLDGYLYQDGNLYNSVTKGNRPCGVGAGFATLEDAFNAARLYCISHGQDYPWWIDGNEAIGWIVTSFDGLTELKHDRSMSTTKTTGQQEGIVLQSGSIIQSEVMDF